MLDENSKHPPFQPYSDIDNAASETQNSEGPGLSYWENHLKCWHAIKENSGDLHVYPKH